MTVARVPVTNPEPACRHNHLVDVDSRGNLTYPAIGWRPVAGQYCYACQTYLWRTYDILR